MIEPIYKTLLSLYPWDYKTAFASEMLSTFQEAYEEQQRRGWGSFLSFLLSEGAGLAVGVGTEWLAKFTTDESMRGRGLPDLRMMRLAKFLKSSGLLPRAQRSSKLGNT